MGSSVSGRAAWQLASGSTITPEAAVYCDAVTSALQAEEEGAKAASERASQLPGTHSSSRIARAHRGKSSCDSTEDHLAWVCGVAETGRSGPQSERHVETLPHLTRSQSHVDDCGGLSLPRCGARRQEDGRAPPPGRRGRRHRIQPPPTSPRLPKPSHPTDSSRHHPRCLIFLSFVSDDPLAHGRSR